ncbi:13846_t:CDS:2 [Dentiscutata erythropus]|uniref:13846_t:CDS:1 n=1 Tax=Dentiscutata erythropus TaxID=1348616 RepID=A0A9N9AE77_9GLOM|nr:13846_t:CDS:2 [Dentiscutata erythropus]
MNYDFLEQPDTPIPANLTVPSGNCFKFLLYGCGVQIYQCITNGNSGSWSQVGPDAYLINDKKTETFTPKYEVAHHYFQQTRKITWQSLVKNDNSLVIAKLIAQSSSPDGSENIPWLKTQATSNQGKGAFDDISYVLRINTKGGVAPPAAQCGTTYSNGTLYRSDYDTEYCRSLVFKTKRLVLTRNGTRSNFL